MNSDIPTILGYLINAVALLVNAFVLYKLNKKTKSFEITVEELRELNNKMHDRLVDVEFKIKSKKAIPENLCKRLLKNSSRLIRYDNTINHDVHYLINNWTTMFLLFQKGNIKLDQLTDESDKLIKLIEKIKNKVNKLQAKS